jgi:hypothetical protein
VKKDKRMTENYHAFSTHAMSLREYVYYNHTRPNAEWWGVFSYGDAPGAIGGGVGSIEWFPTRSALLTFIADVFPYDPPGLGDTGIVASVVTAITANMQHGVISNADGINRLNHALTRYSQITWIGTFAELCNSDDAFCQDVRSWYRKQIDDDQKADIDQHAPIQPAEFDEFCDVIQEYGL